MCNMCGNLLVSIIIPVYNAEPYLQKCLDSILKNKSVPFELLLIDDGSFDDSHEICESYTKKDHRVHLFSKNNGGASAARNVGLKHACGEWVTFVDADDSILIDDWAFLLNCHEDLVMLPHCTQYKHLYECHRLPLGLSFNNFSNCLSLPSFKTACSKFYKRSLLQGLMFNEGVKVGEDQLFLLEYLNRIHNLRVVDTPFYEYRLEDITYGRKYHLTVDESIRALVAIYSAYERLHVRDRAFEADTFKSFKFLCQEYIDSNSASWYNDKRVKMIYTKLKDSLELGYRVKYGLLSFKLFAKFWHSIKS